MRAARTTKPPSSRKKTRLDHQEGGPSGPPSFSCSRVSLIKCSRGPSLLDGRRPAVPSGLKSERQLMAAAPITREGQREMRFLIHRMTIRFVWNRPNIGRCRQFSLSCGAAIRPGVLARGHSRKSVRSNGF